jgi:hypothetical protein
MTISVLLSSFWMPLGAMTGGSGEDVRGPRWFSENAIVYGSFDAAPQNTLFERSSGVEVVEPVPPRRTGGFIGDALDTTGRPLRLQGACLSPHRPWTLSFWWALPADLPVDGGFGLFGLSGKGYIGAFVRGKGDWCALQRPAGVLQLYYFAGMRNVNDIYDMDVARTLALRARVWHHTAAVFRMGSVVELYNDGSLASRIITTGRAFRPEDDMRNLEIGGGVWLDEVALLNRAVSADQIADYVQGMRQIAEYLRGE